MTDIHRMGTLVWLVVATVIAGCGSASGPDLSRPPTGGRQAVETIGGGSTGPDRGFTRERVYFVTNRDRKEDSNDPNEYFVSETGKLRFGACDVSIPYKRASGTLPEPSLLKLEFTEDPKKHIVLLKIDLLDRESLRSALSARIGASPREEALLFIHGYNNTFRDAARRTAQLAYDLDFQGAAMFFTWPAGNPNYLADLRRADASIDECVEAMRLLSRECGAKKNSRHRPQHGEPRSDKSAGENGSRHD